MKLYAITDKGKKRELNEDYIYTSAQPVGKLPNLLIVADGMGGHNAGDYASEHTVKKVVEVIKELTSEESVEDILSKAINEANEYIYNCSLTDESLNGMGTTLVVASCEDDKLTVANVGDSRLYVVNEKITQITKDHSYVEEMVSCGGLDKESARNHPDKNIITRAIGVKKTVDTDIFNIEIKDGDIVLLCSDGLTNMLEDEVIHRIIAENDIEKATEILIKEANENGGRDNITVVLAKPLEGSND